MDASSASVYNGFEVSAAAFTLDNFHNLKEACSLRLNSKIDQRLLN